jgi:hypothetical protein
MQKNLFCIWKPFIGIDSLQGAVMTDHRIALVFAAVVNNASAQHVVGQMGEPAQVRSYTRSYRFRKLFPMFFIYIATGSPTVPPCFALQSAYFRCCTSFAN